DPAPAALEVGALLLDVGRAGLGQVERAAAVALLDADEALVLQLGERRVDAAGAGAPRTACALLDGLHDRVAVARLLGQQEQRGGADVAAPGTAAAGGPGGGPAEAPREGRAPPAVATATVAGLVDGWAVGEPEVIGRPDVSRPGGRPGE